MSDYRNRLKCRVCTWSVTKGNDQQDLDRAFKALSNHIGDEHYELDEILDVMRAEGEDEEAELRLLSRQLVGVQT